MAQEPEFMPKHHLWVCLPHLLLHLIFGKVEHSTCRARKLCAQANGQTRHHGAPSEVRSGFEGWALNSPKWSKNGKVLAIASTNCCVETLPDVSMSEKALTRSGRGELGAAMQPTDFRLEQLEGFSAGGPGLRQL